MKPKFNLWIENKGTVVLSEWRVRLLQAIASGGSLSAAAAKMRVPVRRAREKLAEMERGLGFKLVEPDPANPEYIVTVRGSGYAFEEDTRPHFGAPRKS